MADDGLFELSGHDDDEPFDAMPPPLSPSQDLFANGDENGEVSKLAEVPEAKRKGVKRPQPKLDSNRLVSDRGLPALRTLFKDVHFKGKGYETEDLRVLMKMMENWAHRLFPKLQFEDFIDKVERLGAKKEVQTCLKRIRLDMPLTHEDYSANDGAEPPLEEQIFGDPDPFGGEHLSDSPLRLVHSTPAPLAPPTPLSPPSLTEEQLQRMAMNRLKALEKRLAKQQTESMAVVEDSSQTAPSVSQNVEEVPEVDKEGLITSTQEQSQKQDGTPENPMESTQAEESQTSPVSEPVQCKTESENSNTQL